MKRCDRFAAASEGRPRHERPDLGGILGGVPGRILAAWREIPINLVLSASILAEYRAVGAAIESRYGGQEFEAFVALLAVNSELIDAPERLEPPVCSDSDDDKFLACARVGASLDTA